MGTFTSFDSVEISDDDLLGIAKFLIEIPENLICGGFLRPRTLVLVLISTVGCTYANTALLLISAAMLLTIKMYIVALLLDFTAEARLSL